MRYHVHMAITAENWQHVHPVLTLSIDAVDDQEAQEYAMVLLPDLKYDVVEIESET